jgi:CubicO group peptidase (beta-lactamase class C family)
MRTPRTALLATVVVALAATTVAGAAPASAQPVLESAVFDPAKVQWASWRDQNEVQFQTTFDGLSRDHYLVMDLDVDSTPAGLRLGATWQYNTDHRAWRLKPKLTKAQFDAESDAAKRSNLRLHDIESYLIGQTRYYGAVWIENREGLDAKYAYDLNYAQAVSYYESMKGRYVPVDVDIYPGSSAGSDLYSIVWLENAGNIAWRMHLRLTDAEFKTRFDAYDVAGFRSLVVDSARIGDQWYAGIWLASPESRQWRMRRNMTSQEYLNWYYQYQDEGFREIGFERYETAAGTRYASVWRQNSDRPWWPHKTLVDTRVQKELDDFTVPGISVAVMQNGEFVYRRGFGHADKANDVRLDSNHVLRTASVSKPIGGVLTLKMYEMSEVNPFLPTSTYLPGLLPADHGHTVEQLAGMRGCIRHYADADKFPEEDAIDELLQTVHYGSALEPAEVLWDSALRDDCDYGERNYSTHSYTILGAALEAAGGMLLPDLIRQALVNPYQLGTLQPEDLTASGIRRAKIYKPDNSEATPDENTWSILGGGMESSAADLAAFGGKLLAGQILHPLTLKLMFTDSQYDDAWGWNTYNVDDADGDSHLVASKTGGQLGSDAYLQVFPDDDIVIAVLSNRRGATDDNPDSHDTADVGAYIGQLMIDALP